MNGLVTAVNHSR